MVFGARHIKGFDLFIILVTNKIVRTFFYARELIRYHYLINIYISYRDWTFGTIKPFFSISKSSNFRNSFWFILEKIVLLSGFLVLLRDPFYTTNILFLSAWTLSEPDDPPFFSFLIISIDFSIRKAFYFILDETVCYIYFNVFQLIQLNLLEFYWQDFSLLVLFLHQNLFLLIC